MLKSRTKILLQPPTTTLMLNPYQLPDSFVEFLPLCTIRTGAGFEPFNPYPYQVELAKILELHERIVIYKDRQIGVSEILAAYSYYKTAYDPSYNAVFMSLTQTRSSEAKLRAEKLNPLPHAKKLFSSGAKLQLEFGGETAYVPCTENAARGIAAPNVMVYDELGFYKKPEEKYSNSSNAQNSVPAHRRKSIVATTVAADGMANYTWELLAQGETTKGQAQEYLEMARNGGTNCNVPGMTWWVNKYGMARVIVSHKAHPVYGSDPNYLQGIQERDGQPWAIVLRENNLGIDAATGTLFTRGIYDCATGGWQSSCQPHQQNWLFVDPNFGGEDNWASQVWDLSAAWHGDGRNLRKYNLLWEDVRCQQTTLISIEHMWDAFLRYNCQGICIESNSGGKILAENFMLERPSVPILLTLTTHASKIVHTDRIALMVERQQLAYPAKWEGIQEMQMFSAEDRKAIRGHDDRVMAMAAGFAQLETIIASYGRNREIISVDY